MGGKISSSSSSRLALLLLGVVVPPAVTLVWLGLQLLEQDRALLTQRELESRQLTAQTVIRFLEQSLTAAEQLTETRLSAGMVRFRLSPGGLKAEPAGRMLWFPVVPELEEVKAHRFSEAEKLEFQGSPEHALLAYKKMVNSPETGIRAGAVLRLARVHRRARRWDEALAAYRQLIQMNQIVFDSTPVDLLARRATCHVLSTLGKGKELARVAASLESDFLGGRWVLDRPGWELTARQLEQWTGHEVPVSADQQTFSAVAEWLWQRWQLNGKAFPTLGRMVVQNKTTLVWRTESDVLAIAPSVLRDWTAQIAVAEHVSLLTEGGQVLAGPKPQSGFAVVKQTPSETSLPWTIVLNPSDSSLQAEEFSRRRRLLSLGLVAIVLLLAGGSYFLWSVIQRELAVARLQTDFVSAVSHEFRTPLASLRHVTELMQENDDLPVERRQLFYQSLNRNTERLHRLVESLLDFARMEGRRKPYSFETVDGGELVSQIVADFRKEVEPRGFTVDLEVETSDETSLRADAAALTNALRNLLDNAVKYSNDGRHVRVSVHSNSAGVVISVQDDGLGIPTREQKEIFRRFVRGDKASRLGIKGTGLGLAMVSHIVRAHGGTIELESKEGAGSTFRLVLPAHG